MEAYQEILNAIRNNDLTFLDSEESEAVFDVAKIRQICEELADIREKYRWRKQSEEPAPKGEEVEIITSSSSGKVLLCGRCIIGEDFWRPLDLPAEDKK